MTTVFKIRFKDGREFRVFCENYSQVKRFRNHLQTINDKVQRVDTITNGIHTINQFINLKN